MLEAMTPQELIEKQKINNTILRVSIKDGVLEDRMFEKTNIMYSEELYNSNGTRKKEFYGRYQYHYGTVSLTVEV